MPVDGGERARVDVGSLHSWWQWDESRSGIYYVTTPAAPTVLNSYGFGKFATYTLHFLDSSTGGVTDLLQLEGVNSLTCVAVSPDEEWILFVEIPAGESELVLVEDFR